MEEAIQGFLLLISVTLLIVNLTAVAWIHQIACDIEGMRGERLIRIIAGMVYGVTIAQMVLVFSFVLINTHGIEYRAIRLGLVALSQMIVATSMVWTIIRIRRI